MAVDLQKIVDAGVHIATLKREAHSKTRDFWLDVVNGVVVLNPERIAERLDKARDIIQKAKKEKKNILVVCEKKIYHQELADLCEKGAMYYLNHKVPAGFLSNLDTFMRRIDSVNEMRRYMDSEAFDSLTKKEQAVYKRKYDKVNRLYKGVSKLSGKPELVIVVDGTMLAGFVKDLELQKDLAKIIISSTNFNDYPGESDILANMLSYKSLDFVMNYLLS